MLKIATRYLVPELAGSRLTPKVCLQVAEAFVSKYGKYAGWAQTLLFIAELPSQKAILPESFWSTDKTSPAKVPTEAKAIKERNENSGNKRKKRLVNEKKSVHPL